MSDTSMDIYDIIMAMLDSENGIRGRTAIQKLVYLAKAVHPNLDVPEYKPHYYGPFSTEVGETLSALVSYSFVYETRLMGSRYLGYRYQLTKDGKDVIKDIKEQHGAEYNTIRNLVDKCQELCSLRIHSLSFASKIWFMQMRRTRGSGPMSEDHLRERGRDLGWEMDDQDINGGIRLLKDLGLDPSR